MIKFLYHHLGVACHSIEDSISTYKLLGYFVDYQINDEVQGVKLCFMRSTSGPLVELVSPLKGGSPVDNILTKSGTTPYHSCYLVDDLNVAINYLEDVGFTLIVEPVPAIAFEFKKICFLYHRDSGLIELLESK